MQTRSLRAFDTTRKGKTLTKTTYKAYVATGVPCEDAKYLRGEGFEARSTFAPMYGKPCVTVSQESAGRVVVREGEAIIWDVSRPEKATFLSKEIGSALAEYLRVSAAKEGK